MSDSSVQVTITLSDSLLKDEELEKAVQNLKLELQEVEGVSEAALIPIEQGEPNSMGIGGFLIDKVRALVNLNNMKTLVNFIGSNTFGKTIEIEAKGNGKELKIKLSRPEDMDKVMPQVERFING